MKYVYIACPYTIGDPAVNVRRCIDAADSVAAMGLVPFAPLLSHFWHLIHPHGYQFWIDQTLAWLERCDAVLRLPGESKGADAEVAHALQRGMPVVHDLDALRSLIV